MDRYNASKARKRQGRAFGVSETPGSLFSRPSNTVPALESAAERGATEKGEITTRHHTHNNLNEFNNNNTCKRVSPLTNSVITSAAAVTDDNLTRNNDNGVVESTPSKSKKRKFHLPSLPKFLFQPSRIREHFRRSTGFQRRSSTITKTRDPYPIATNDNVSINLLLL